MTTARRQPSAPPRLRLEALETRTTPATLSTFLTTEHVDLNVLFAGGTFSLQPRDDDNQIAYAPDVALLYTGINAATARPAGSEFDFVGVAAGETFYRLPQSQNPDLMYLGVAGYGVPGAAVNRYDATAESGGRVTGTGEWLKLTLDGVTGPGDFSVWQSGDTAPTVLMSTAAGGVTADDALWVLAGGHIHYNWGFTEPGRYEVRFRASANVNTDGNQNTPESVVTGDVVTLYFSVGNVGRFEFAAADVDVNEDTGTALVTVNRVGGSDGRMAVNYATSNGSATAGQDYAAASGTPTFNDGETSKTFTVPITNDPDEEGNETINLTLSAPAPANIAGYAVGLPGGSLLGTQAAATITILASDPNTDPTISDIADRTTPEDTPTTVTFTVGDSPTPSAQLTVTAISDNPMLVPNLPANLAFGGSGANRTLTVAPAGNQSGTATITVTVTDPSGRTATDTFVLTVTPVNDPPAVSAVPDVTMDEDTEVTVNFTVGDPESAPGALAVSWDSDPASLVLVNQTLLGGSAANRTLRLIANPDHSGTATITLTVSDGTGGATSATFTVTVTPVYDSPRTQPDNLLAVPGTTSTLDVLGNDTAIEPGQTFTLQSFTQPAHGTLTAGPDGTVRYTPAAGYEGADEFAYTVVDNTGRTSTETAYVTVAAYLLVDSPDGPQHTDVGYNYVGGQWVLNVHTDAAFGPGGAFGGGNNSTVLDADEGLLFLDPSTRLPRPADPLFDFLGTPAGADIWLAPNTPEGDQIYLGFSTEQTPHGTFATFPSTDARVAGQNAEWMVLELVGFSGPGQFSLMEFGSFGELRLWMDTADGLNDATDAAAGGNPADSYWGFAGTHAHLNWVFTAAGRYEVQFRAVGWVDDGAGGLVRVESPVTTYSFDVDAETAPGARLGEAPPVATADAADAAEDGGPVTVDVLGNDSASPDPLEALAVTAVTQGANGAVAIAPGGTAVTYTPAAGFFGTDTFTYTVTDEHDGTATTTVTVTVAEANDPPAATADDYEVTPGNALRGNVLVNDGDGDGDPLAAAVASGPAHGALTLNPDGSFTYTPGATFAGADTFTYTVSDGRGGTDTGTVTIAGRPAPTGFPAVLSEGHVDVGVAYEGGEFEPHVHDEETDTEYGPDEVAFHFRPQAERPRPAGAAFDFLGVPAGAAIWQLPHSPPNPELLLLGLGTEEIEDGVFAGDEVSVRLLAVNGPGHFAVWRSGLTGPEVFFATADGVSGADLLTGLAGGHDDLNWGFTAPGVYTVAIQPFGTLSGGEAVAGEPATYTFVVAPVNPPPTLTAPATVGTTRDTPVALTGVQVTDSNPAGGDYRVELAATSGTVSVPPTAGVTVTTGTGTNDTLLVIEGALVAVNQALAGLVLTPATGFVGTASLSVTVTDPGELVGAENAGTVTATVTVTVASPALRPTVRVERVADAAEPGTAGLFRFTRTGDLSVPLTLTYAVSGTATAWADYAALAGMVTFAAGAATADVVVAPVDDAVTEKPETVVVTLTFSGEYDVAGASATVAVADDDRHPEPIAVGTGSGGTARLVGGDGALKVMLPYGATYTGEVRVATGDVTGDGIPDLITGTGPGAAPVVKVFDAVTGAEVLSVVAFESSFTGGIFVSAGDLDGDGRAEIVVSPDQSGGGRVVIFSHRGVPLASFFGIDDAAFRGGARVAVGDVDGDGTPDVVVTAGFGGGPRVAVFDGGTVFGTPTRLMNDFFAFEPALRNGAFAAAGDVDGDGFDDLVFGAGPGGAPRVLVFDGGALMAGRFVPLADLFAGDTTGRAGVRVAALDTDADGRAEVVSGPAEGRTVSVYRVTAGGVELASATDWFETPGGVYVG